MKIEIKSRFTNESELLFAHDCENNTIKITVEAAVKGGAFLDGASLGGAFLRDKENPIESIKQIGNIGSRGGFTIAFKCKKSIEINCGCFWGTIEEFEEAVKEKHAGTKYETEYMAAIEFFRKVL